MTSKNVSKNRVFLRNFYANLQIPNFAEISQKWYELSFNDPTAPLFAENSEILLKKHVHGHSKFWTFEIGKISEISAKNGTFTPLKLKNYTILGILAKM